MGVFRKPPQRKYPPGGACPVCKANARPHCRRGCGWFVCQGGTNDCDGLVFEIRESEDHSQWLIVKRIALSP